MFDVVQRLIQQVIQKSRRDAAAGFTVIEVIAALAVLSVALAVLFGTLSDGFYHQGRARTLAEATNLAQSVLARAGTEFPLQPGVKKGEEENGLHWTLSITPYGTPTDRKAWPVAAYEIVAAVFENEQSGEPVLALTTLRLGTKVSNQ
jgi:general secretion pathway protein I